MPPAPGGYRSHIADAAHTESFWLSSAPAARARPPLAGTQRTEIAVLGGGIAGVTAAYLIACEGIDVTLLEAVELGIGATGNTTAKVTSAHGLRYASLRRKHGEETAAAYASLNEQAIALIEATAAREGIDCAWRRRDAFTYSTDPRRREELAEEARAAADAGLKATLVDETPLPFDVAAAVRIADQAEFHPVMWLRGLADAAERAGARIHEHSRALEVSAGDPCRVRTDAGELLAERVIVATHYPTLDRGAFFARLSAQRSYCLGVHVSGELPAGMFLSADSPTRSLRSHPLPGGGELAIVGGEGHATGEETATGERYAALEEWARIHFDVAEVPYRWSAQDPMPPDGLPYVGALHPGSDRLLVATGFQKWGMTNGTAAAAILRDRLTGRDNAEGETWSANRFDPIAAGPTLVKKNLKVARHFVGDRLARTRAAEELAPGEGAIVREGVRRIAAYRDDGGELHELSATCTHLGCEVRFNEAERSWDCPCHGSRFDAADGAVIEGPAVHALEPIRATT